MRKSPKTVVRDLVRGNRVIPASSLTEIAGNLSKEHRVPKQACVKLLAEAFGRGELHQVLGGNDASSVIAFEPRRVRTRRKKAEQQSVRRNAKQQERKSSKQVALPNSDVAA